MRRTGERFGPLVEDIVGSSAAPEMVVLPSEMVVYYQKWWFYHEKCWFCRIQVGK